MATYKVDSTVLRNKSELFKNGSNKIFDLYETMLQEMKTINQQQVSDTIIEGFAKFSQMQPKFEAIKKDMFNYSQFLLHAAENYEKDEIACKQDASDEGIKI
jgi:hypothetical protein